MRMKIKCSVTYQGAARRPALRIGDADRRLYFSRDNRNIIVEIDGTKFYTKLTDDFFWQVGQIRTLYEKPNAVTANVLVKWMETNKLKVGDEVYLEVIEKNKCFKLVKSI